ncbi:hypothetical protein ACFUOZ_20725 [Paenarthrobacter sp. NPDC057355]|uniref:hypothetical protein n=1 Tax=Paenarthrobacter sp. NPDC057355 TaxID=3346105 RepID=UPI003631A93B
MTGPDDGGGVGGFPGYTPLQDVLTALRSLPTAWQEILWRADVLGADPGDIAARMGLTRAAVDLLTGQAHEALRTAYREHYPTPNNTGQEGLCSRGSGDPDE